MDRDVDARRIAAEHAAAAPTGWFEELYRAAGDHGAVVPWDRGEPSDLVATYLRGLPESARRGTAMVVGAGLGRDSELVGALGWRTTAFDVSPTAVRMTKERFPGSSVTYLVADLLESPDDWRKSFDLVVENMTVQSLPHALRAEAVAAVTSLVSEGGTLLVVAAARLGSASPAAGPPWPLSREEVESFAQQGVHAEEIELIPDAQDSGVHRWRAVFRRDGPAVR